MVFAHFFKIHARGGALASTVGPKISKNTHGGGGTSIYCKGHAPGGGAPATKEGPKS